MTTRCRRNFDLTILLPMLLAVVTAVSGVAVGADEPAELTAAKQKFLGEQKAIADEKPDVLNESYLKRLRSMGEKAQKNGDIDALVAVKKEIESIEQDGRPSSEVSAEVTEKFARMRELYATELARFNAERLKRHAKLVKKYQVQLEALVVTLTKASRIEEAVLVKNESNAAGSLSLPLTAGPAAAENVAEVGGGAAKQGRLRVVGKAIVRSWLPWGGGPIHGEVLSEYSDLVQISGNSSGIMALRSNGDVILESGKIFQHDAYRLFTPHPKFGAMCRDGVFREFQGKFAPVSKPVLQATSGIYRDLSLLENGELAWAGKMFDDGKRIPPPEEVRSGNRQIGSSGQSDYVLTTEGEVKRWNNSGLIDVPDILKRGVKLVVCARSQVWCLTADHRIIDINGERPAEAPEQGQYIAEGGDLFAVLGMDNLWKVVAIGETVGNVVPLLEAVLNHPATVDVAFHLANGHKKDDTTAAYVAWIEDPAVKATPIPVGASLTETAAPKSTNGASGDPPVRSSTATGARFFGIEIR